MFTKYFSIYLLYKYCTLNIFHTVILKYINTHNHIYYLFTLIYKQVNHSREQTCFSENKIHSATNLQPCGISCSLKGPEPVTYAHNKKELRGFLYGKESKKAPGLLKSNANHLLTTRAKPRDRGQIPSVVASFFCV